MGAKQDEDLDGPAPVKVFVITERDRQPVLSMLW